MSPGPDTSERRFEEAVEAVLLAGAPDARGTGTVAVQEPTATYELPEWGLPGGYHRRRPDDFDRSLCLMPPDVIDFILGTQPQSWERLKQHHGGDARDKFLRRLSSEIQARGALDVLRNGIKDSGIKFALAYFRPASALNVEMKRLYLANVFSVVRQLHFSLQNEKSVDLALFLNGIPVFTAELKSPLSGQHVQEAVRQYKTDRDPREPLFAYGRCLAHFAVDPELVFVTTHLNGAGTRFLPFNRGRFGGAGNPPVTPTESGYPTSYLWEETWARDSVLDLVRQVIHEVEEEDDRGHKTGKRSLIFPRYHQLDAVRSMVAHAREHGPGRRYLIQHSAGSGKSFTIAWLAHRLSILHDHEHRRVFDSIVVITDRRVLDRQLQRTVRQFEQTLGVVENIDTTSRQLKEALESGKTIIVTTLQKFPVIAMEIGELPAKRFAVIVDEAHSSQSGESTKSLKAVLSVEDLNEAEREEAGVESPEQELEDRVLEEMKTRGRLPNASWFAFTATPKPKTMELFGTRRDDGRFAPFSLYSMRQAIEEGFILDVLQNYTTYKAYWRLLKKIEEDPHYDRRKAQALLKAFVDLHPHAIGEKVKIILGHFAERVQDRIGGRAKAMIVTRSRLHAVRYKRVLDEHLREKGHPWKALVAFSGAVRDGGKDYTEANMNGFSEGQTAKTFERPEYRFLVVANKFQTGFDQPLLHAMYVDKKLGGVNAVQTLSRLNRTLPPAKVETMVLDFANEADEIKEAFEPYYETTLLSEATDPNLLYEIQTRLLGFEVFVESEVSAFARVAFDAKATADLIYKALSPIVDRFNGKSDEERADFRGQLKDYIRLYAFLAQILDFTDADLEKLYVFARHLRRLLPADVTELPREIQNNIDMESYRVQETSAGRIPLDRQAGKLEPQRSKGHYGNPPEEMEPLSRIIAELNERFGLSLGPEHQATIEQLIAKLDDDRALDASARVNTRENLRLTFDEKVNDVIQEIVDSNFDLYKRITDDHVFGGALKNFLFDLYLRNHREADELLKQHESMTLEFKSTLRWNLRESRKDPSVTHAAIKTIAAFLNTEGGDLVLGVADDRTVVGIEIDRFETEDKFLLHLSQVVRNALGDRAGTCIDPRLQGVQTKTVCLVSCLRSPEPVFLKWKGMEANPEGDFFVRSGPGTVKLSPHDAREYVRTRFPPRSKGGDA